MEMFHLLPAVLTVVVVTYTCAFPAAAVGAQASKKHSEEAVRKLRFW